MKQGKLRLASLLIALFFAFQSHALAVGSAGFENASYSAKTLSQANAVVARPQDPSTILFNPAGLVDLEGIQVSGGLQGLDWRTFHKSAIDGDNGDKSHSDFKIIPLPSFYVSMNPGKLLNDRVAFGFGMNSPFGLRSSWNSEGFARYGGYRNALLTLATTLAGAVRVTDRFKFGAGATNYYVFDYGQEFAYPNAFVLAGAVPGAPDGIVRTETSGYGWGWNMGVLFEPGDHHKLGTSFRSRSNVKVNGRVLVEGLVLGAAQGFDTAPTYETGVTSDIQIPANWTVGYAYEPSEKWAVEADIGLTFWGVFKDQDFGFDRPNLVVRALGTIPRDYHTTWSFHLGGHRQINEKWDMQGGFFFYEAASPKDHVDNFIPDANRYGWTIGTSYALGKRASIDINYLFMLFASRKFSNPEFTVRTGDNIDGRVVSILHGGFVTFTYKFDFPFEKRAQVDSSARVTG